LVCRKRRYGCVGCWRTFTETHPELPTRQRVTTWFRRRLLERVRDGAAHSEVAREERTTRYQVARAFRDGRDQPSSSAVPTACRRSVASATASS
jgi:hypothetical protein